MQDLLLKYELVQLYTNRVDPKLKAEAEKNAALMTEKFRNGSLPLYAIVEPTKDGYRETARIGGLITDIDGFRDFLGTPKTVDKVEFEEILVGPSAARAGETVTLTIRGKPKEGNGIAPIRERAPDQDVKHLSEINFLGSDDLAPLWPLRETGAEFMTHTTRGVALELRKPFTWTMEFLLPAETKPGETMLSFSLRIVASSEKETVQGTHFFSIPVTVKNEKPAVVPPALEERAKADNPPPKVRELPPELKPARGTPVGPPPDTAKLIDLEVTARRAAVRPGEVVPVLIRGTLKPGYHTYPIVYRAPKQEVNQLSRLTFKTTGGLGLLWPIRETMPEWHYDADLGKTNPLEGVALEHKKPFEWVQDVYIPESAKPGAFPLELTIDLQVCEKTCTNGTHTFTIPLTILGERPIPLSDELMKRLEAAPGRPEVLPIPPGVIPGSSGVTEAPPEDDSAGEDVEEEAPQGSGLLAMILNGMFWGAVSLVTPCVFPMIPITVSFFLKQSERENHRPVMLAMVYSGTIIVVLTISAMALLALFQLLSTHYLTNFILGCLFIFFALSLFGLYEIELPGFLSRMTSSREGSGIAGTVFMALTFTIISFACVAPFLGGFAGTATQGTAGSEQQLSLLETAVGGLAFSTTFALPFVVLALFPTLLKKMPRSGTWLNSVKVVMGFIELAAAVAFLRASEVIFSPQPKFFTFNGVLAFYVAVCLLCGLYLFNFYRLPHDTPLEHVGVVRMLFGLMFIGLSFYLLPGLFAADSKGNAQRPRGVVFSWLESFLLPDASASGDLPWRASREAALAEARKTGKRVLIDFTGETCKNCKFNEQTVFPESEVRALLQRYVLLTQYTDKVPAKYYKGKDRHDAALQRRDAKANWEFEREKFSTTQLPLYAVIEPADNKDGWLIVGTPYKEGKINNVSSFVGFLRKNLKKTAK